MPSMNRVFLVGNLGHEPEVRATGSGTPVLTLSVATTERFKDAGGNRKERTDWHRVVAWNDLATNCGKYLKKGDRVLVEGRLQGREYEKDGEKRTSVEVIARNIQFLTFKKGTQAGQPEMDPMPEEVDQVDEEIPF
jgi:single-strand DNA-binding protein